MTIEDDAQRLLDHLDTLGVDGGTNVVRGWNHIGAIIVDATLQRRQRYVVTVLPRVRELVNTWPDAETTDGFRRRIASGDLAKVIRWDGQQRLDQISRMADVLAEHDIETVTDLASAFADADRRSTIRKALRAVPQVGPKTLDYLDILTGSPDSVAVDVRVRTIASAAGIAHTSYDHLSAVIKRAATIRGWRPGDLDAAIWNAGAEREVLT